MLILTISSIPLTAIYRFLVCWHHLLQIFNVSYEFVAGHFNSKIWMTGEGSASGGGAEQNGGACGGAGGGVLALGGGQAGGGCASPRRAGKRTCWPWTSRGRDLPAMDKPEEDLPAVEATGEPEEQPKATLRHRLWQPGCWLQAPQCWRCWAC